MQQKELKYTHVFNEQGQVVSALNISQTDKVNNKYHIFGIDTEKNQIVQEPVYPVISTKKRNHFKRFPKGSSNRNPNFIFSRIGYNESVIHKMTKSLLESHAIKVIYIPPCKASIGDRQFTILDNTIFNIANVELEKRIDIDDNTYIVVDALVTDSNGSKIAIEIRATHAVDNAKAEKARKAGLDMIEINISSLLNNKDTFGIEDKIANLLTYKYDSVITWISNRRLREISEWSSHQLIFDLSETKKDKEIDGDWYIWAGDRLAELVNCPYKAEIGCGPTDRRWLCEKRHCGVCRRGSVSSLDGTPIRLRCNQSNIDDSTILNYITNINKISG